MSGVAVCTRDYMGGCFMLVMLSVAEGPADNDEILRLRSG
jgi:hypothetical protein